MVRLIARVRDLEATMEVVKTDFTANFCSVQNLQQGTNLMGEQVRTHQSGMQDMQRQILAMQDEVPRLRSRLQASEEAMGLLQDTNRTVGLKLDNMWGGLSHYRRASEISNPKLRGSSKV